IPLDAKLSYDLLLSIFRPGSPLHDGAVIVEGSRVAAAGCFLPLSLNPMISKQLGTRHRAAIGVTEDSDCVVVLVSEETGSISFASTGTIETNLSPEDLSDRLSETVMRRRTTAVLPAALASARTTVRR
ncbi:MAG: diadenylate cyclase, partial [Candidatus Acidiferrales bacterium]